MHWAIVSRRLAEEGHRTLPVGFGCPGIGTRAGRPVRRCPPAGLLGKSPDADLLREMPISFPQRLMELEVGGLTGAAFGEKSPERLARRASRATGSARRHGRDDPRTLYFPASLEPRRMAEKALTAVIRAYIQGISTRSVDDLGEDGDERHLQEPGLAALRRDRRTGPAFLDRPIEGDWPYLWIDATLPRRPPSSLAVTRRRVGARRAAWDGYRSLRRDSKLAAAWSAG